MAWIYLAELEDSPLPWRNGSDQLPIVKTTHMPRPCFCHECGVVNSKFHPSGTTCEHSTDTLFARIQILSLEDSHARTSVLRDMVSVWKENVAASIGKCIDLSKNLSRHSFSSKTSLRFVPAELAKWSHPLPHSGILQTGMLYPRAKSARPFWAKDGFFLPRPTAKHYGSNKGGSGGRIGAKVRHSIHQLATKGLLPGHPKAALNREYLEMVMGYPLRWTVIAAWVIPWYISKRKKHLENY